MARRWGVLIAFCAVATASSQSLPPWQPAAGPLMTRWAKDVSPSRLPEYPRPQMVRDRWFSLDGLWDYAIRPKDESAPTTFDGRILVPFPIESALSGVMKKVGESNRLWYRRTFERPSSWRGRRTLLHFGAVDWEATVIVNGTTLATHRGGYDGFTVDLTAALRPAGLQEIVVGVWDPTDTGTQPRGKQVNRPNGIWYTSVTGIWQTVWLEPVAATAIDSVVLVPDIDAGTVTITVNASGPEATSANVWANIRDGSRVIGLSTGARSGTPFVVPVKDAKLWSPSSPKLCDVTIGLGTGTEPRDEVKSYVGMRKISLCHDAAGTNRLCLNNAPLFQVGPLDQGWWPDGLYTAPTDAALKYDIEVTKQLGFNMARKHVKVEPDRWYAWADRLGLLVWQDMPSTSLRGTRTPESAQQFESELRALIDQRRNHPSIVMWVPFNEGWGQYDTPRIVDWIRTYDPSRLVDNASGWTDAKVGDVSDVHRYPGPGAPKTEPDRAAVLGEFGGLGLPLEGHTWQAQANWSYRGFTTQPALTDAYVDLLTKLHLLEGTPGLSAAVYTQTTDVEIEVNGLMTYDRAVIKPDVARVRAANLALFTPAPVMTTILETSRDRATTWRFTTTAPPENWAAANFDDAGWSSGEAGFGARNPPASVIRTPWTTADIWIRRTFDIAPNATFSDPRLLIHHDEDAEVFIDGTRVLAATGYTQDYEVVAASVDLRPLLRAGHHTIAVHCHQTTGGQYLDVGLVDIRK